MDISRSDNGDIFGNPQPRFQNRLDRSRRDRVVVAEHAVGRVAERQQLAHGDVTGNVVVLTADHIFRQGRKTRLGQGAPVSPQPSDSGLNGRTPNMGDPPAALFDQVPGGERSNLIALDPDEIRIEARRHAVDQNIRNFAAAQRRKQAAPSVRLGGRHDQAVYVREIRSSIWRSSTSEFSSEFEMMIW